jgi:hypothetical protein
VGKASAKKGSGKDRRARLEEMKAQQRREARRRNALTFGSAGAVGVIILAAAIVPSYLHDQAQKDKQKVGYIASPTKAERAAGCTGVRNDKPDAGAQHTEKAVDYKEIPPSGGFHNPDPLPAAAHFFSLAQKPAPERAVHNLEHGFVVGWFDDKLPSDQVTALQNLSTATDLGRLVSVGWTRGDLPDNKHFVLTSWARTERCEKVSADVIRAFVKAHADDKKLAPEAGGSGGSNTPPNLLQPSMGSMPAPSATATAKK